MSKFIPDNGFDAELPNGFIFPQPKQTLMVVRLILLVVLLLAAAFTVILVALVPVRAQQPAEQTYTLVLKEKVLGILWDALREAPLPRRITDEAVNEINRQIIQQNNEKAARDKIEREKADAEKNKDK